MDLGDKAINQWAESQVFQHDKEHFAIDGVTTTDEHLSLEGNNVVMRVIRTIVGCYNGLSEVLGNRCNLDFF